MQMWMNAVSGKARGRKHENKKAAHWQEGGNEKHGK